MEPKLVIWMLLWKSILADTKSIPREQHMMMERGAIGQDAGRGGEPRISGADGPALLQVAMAEAGIDEKDERYEALVEEVEAISQAAAAILKAIPDWADGVMISTRLPIKRSKYDFSEFYADPSWRSIQLQDEHVCAVYAVDSMLPPGRKGALAVIKPDKIALLSTQRSGKYIVHRVMYQVKLA